MRRGTSVAAASQRNVRPARRHTAAGWKWTQEVSVAKEDRGFASMDRAKQREIASKGGKAAHQKGTAHEWTSEEAREAGRKGGMASHRRRKESDGQGADSDTPSAAERSAGDQGEPLR
jgi:uncharacterized protein